MGTKHVYVHLLLFSSLIVSAVTAELSKAKLDNIDDFVNGFMDCLGIPGLTLSIVHEGQVELSKGYGKTSLNPDHGPVKDVDSTTLFNIGSTTKAFTAVLLAQMLHQNGSITWDTPVQQILPRWVTFSDEYRAKETTLRDLMAHKMGVPRNDVQFFLDKWSREELMDRIQYFKPVLPFRTQLLYNNMMVTVAGYIAETLAKHEQTWEELVNHHIFTPLGMRTSNFMNLVEDHDNFAIPYMGNAAVKVAIPWEMFSGTRSFGPAGSVATNADDMSKWIKYLLGESHPDLSHDRALETFKDEFLFAGPNFLKPFAPETMAMWDKYAKGWMTGYYRGYRVVEHAGDFTGYAALVYLMPDLNYGSFSSMNFPDNGIQRLQLHAYISDIILDKTPWFNLTDVCGKTVKAQSNHQSVPPLHNIRGVHDESFMDIFNSNHRSQDKMSAMNQYSRNNVRTMEAISPLSDYVGLFGNFAYGNITITLNVQGNQLEMNYGRNGRFNLIPTEPDVFLPIGIGSPSNLISLGPISFGRSDNKVHDLTIPSLETLAPPTFIKDLKQSDAPPPAPC